MLNRTTITATKEDLCPQEQMDSILRGVFMSLIQFLATWGRPWLSR